MNARRTAPVPRDVPAALSPAEEWCVDTVARMNIPDDEIGDAVHRSFGASVNHEAITSEVKRRRKA